MSNAKHTSGQWDQDGPRIYSAESHLIATTTYLRNAPGEEMANTRLIAAAPAILDALRAAHRMLTRDYIYAAKMAAIEQCDAAIASATGASHE